MQKKHKFEVYALLWVSRQSQDTISQLLHSECKIPKPAIQSNLHLTVYYGRRKLPELTPYCESVNIIADTIETRFMVFVPGGENPRYNIEPSERSVGIRFTRRNCAIDKIQSLRADIYRLETKDVIGNRKATSAWRNCFGARNYQPHIKLLWPNNKIDRDLTKLGTVFRSNLDHILFDRFEVKCNWA